MGSDTENRSGRSGGARFQTSCTIAGATAYLREEDESLIVFYDQGTFVVEDPWSEPVTEYLGSGRFRGSRRETHWVSPVS